MKLGAYTAILHDRPLPEALDVIKSLGLDGAEVDSGGFLPPVHIRIDEILFSQSARTITSAPSPTRTPSCSG